MDFIFVCERCRECIELIGKLVLEEVDMEVGEELGKDQACAQVLHCKYPVTKDFREAAHQDCNWIVVHELVGEVVCSRVIVY